MEMQGILGLKMGTEITAMTMPWKRTPRKRENVKYKSRRNIELRQQWWIRCFYRIRAAKKRDKFHSGCDAMAGSQNRTLLGISGCVKAKEEKVEIDRALQFTRSRKRKKPKITFIVLYCWVLSAKIFLIKSQCRCHGLASKIEKQKQSKVETPAATATRKQLKRKIQIFRFGFETPEERGYVLRAADSRSGDRTKWKK